MSIYVNEFEEIYCKSSNLKFLREKVLRLAMQGEFTKDTNYGISATKTAEDVINTRINLEKNKKIKKWKKIDKHISHDFNYPNLWSEMFLGNIGDWGAGATPKRGNSEYWSRGTIPWLKTGELNNSYVTESQEFITSKALNETSVRLNKKGDVLIAMYGATIGKVAILDFVATTNQACCACTPFEGIYNKYVFYLLMSLKKAFNDSGEGGAQPNISKEKIVNTKFGLPSTQEQYDIVNKIEFLFAQIDQLEEKLKKKEHLLKLLPSAVVDAIGSCKTSEQLKTQLLFIIENFDEIFQTPESMQELRNVILQLAIEGKLVEQDSSDEPASELIERIKIEKDKLVEEKKIRKPKKLEPITEEEKPFEIPESWEWIRATEVCHMINYGYTAKSLFNDTGTKMLRITDIQNGKVNWDIVPFCEIEEKKLLGYILNKNDVVIARTGGTVGKSFIVKEINCQSVYASYLIRLLPSSDMNADYFYNYLQSPYYWEQLIDGTRGGAQPNVNATTLGNLIIPLPPLEEQLRINNKIKLLMSVIDEMEDKLKKKQQIIKLLGMA